MTENRNLTPDLQVELLASQVGKSSKQIIEDAGNLKLKWNEDYADPFDHLARLLQEVGQNNLTKLQAQIAHIGNLSIDKEFLAEVEYEDNVELLGTMCGAFNLGHSAEQVQAAVRELFPFQNIGSHHRL